MYQPTIIMGRVSGTGWPIDGHVLCLSMWSYDNYASWHLHGWEDESNEAVMLTMFQTEQDAGLGVFDTLDEFKVAWDSGEYEPMGTFCIELENVELLKVIQEEQRGEKREIIRPRKENERGGVLCLPLAENLTGDVRAKHPDWKPMVCPRCGRDCWKPSGVDELQKKQGLTLVCTRCALAEGLGVPGKGGAEHGKV